MGCSWGLLPPSHPEAPLAPLAFVSWVFPQEGMSLITALGIAGVDLCQYLSVKARQTVNSTSSCLVLLVLGLQACITIPSFLAFLADF